MYSRRDSKPIRQAVNAIAWRLPGRPTFRVKVDVRADGAGEDTTLEGLLDEL